MTGHRVSLLALAVVATVVACASKQGALDTMRGSWWIKHYAELNNRLDAEFSGELAFLMDSKFPVVFRRWNGYSTKRAFPLFGKMNLFKSSEFGLDRLWPI